MERRKGRTVPLLKIEDNVWISPAPGRFPFSGTCLRIAGEKKAIAAAVEEVERSKRKKDEVMDEDIDEDNSLLDKSGSQRIKLNTEDNDTESKTNFERKKMILPLLCLMMNLIFLRKKS